MWNVAARLLAYSYVPPALACLMLYPIVACGEMPTPWLFYPCVVLAGMSAVVQLLALLTTDVFPRTPFTRPVVAFVSNVIGFFAYVLGGSEPLLNWIIWYGLCQWVVLALAGCWGLSKLAKQE